MKIIKSLLVFSLFILGCEKNYTTPTRRFTPNVTKHSFRYCLNLSSGEYICRITVERTDGKIKPVDMCHIVHRDTIRANYIPCEQFETIRKVGVNFK